MKAGLIVSAAMETGADQAINTILALTPPPQTWPLITHARAVAAHVVYGGALG